MLANRYRIVALLGKGGMGEVYRADDLTLGQPVALKFLPKGAPAHSSVLERFRNEVRIARAVSHPNVCRVYDVGEVEGHTFFTMEYVDGEDLSSLLRRIGRLPSDKALEMARQLCHGLAAAHAKGVLHRDLKPANIMLDGRGQVVITDFGLAGFVDQIHGAEVRSGTPAYMAPEQLAGKEVTAKSDIYSLGLVLYEMFTGKRAFDAENLAELVRVRNERPPIWPSALVKELDPAVERAVFRCLEPDPAGRPSSVLAVAAGLPGGDPLAAALAAGETPSPQMVAAAGDKAGLKPRIAITCATVLIVALAIAAYLGVHLSALEKMGLEQGPEVLRQKARDLIARLGYEARPFDSATGFFYDTDFKHHAETNDKPHPRWDELLSRGPALLQFWYRQSPQYMVPVDFHDSSLSPGIVTTDDPPPVLSGMIQVDLDPRGQLTLLEAIPPQREDSTKASSPANWDVLFSAAGLDRQQFQPVTPRWTSLGGSEERAAWTGTWPGTNRALRIEAAAWHGQPVYFSLIGPWTKPARMQADDESKGQKAGEILFSSLLMLVMFGGAWLARRNYVQGKGDRSGAARLASFVFVLHMLLWVSRGHMVPTLGILVLFILALSTSLFSAGLTWVLYLALEPYVRRHWPQSIISWTRLLTGQWRDPLVGRDVLFGVMLGMFWVLTYDVRSWLGLRMGDSPWLSNADYLMAGRTALGTWLIQIPGSIQGTLLFFFLLLVFRIFLRKDWLAGAAFALLFAGTKFLGSHTPAMDVPMQLIIYGVAAFAVIRFGFVALAAGIFSADVLLNLPLTANFSAWYAGTSALALLSVVALAAWGFYNALARQSIWEPELLK